MTEGYGCVSMRGGVVAAAAAIVAEAAAWRRQYLAAGRAGSEPGVQADHGVLLVHGFAASMDQMRHQREALEGTHAVVSVDLRGHGRSGWPGPRRVDMDRLARDLAQVLESSTRGPVVVVTHSMGGMVVMALAQSRLELVGSVIAGAALISTSPGHLAYTALPAPAARAMDATRLSHVALALGWLVAPVVDRLHPFRSRWGRTWLARRFVADPARHPAVPDTMADIRSELPRSDTHAFYPAMVDHDGTPGLDVLRRVPVLVLSGTEDRTIPCEHSERIAEKLGPSARLVLVPGSGHMVNVTHAEVVNRELHDLVRRSARPIGDDRS